MVMRQRFAFLALHQAFGRMTNLDGTKDAPVTTDGEREKGVLLRDALSDMVLDVVLDLVS